MIFDEEKWLIRAAIISRSEIVINKCADAENLAQLSDVLSTVHSGYSELAA